MPRFFFLRVDVAFSSQKIFLDIRRVHRPKIGHLDRASLGGGCPPEPERGVRPPPNLPLAQAELSITISGLSRCGQMDQKQAKGGPGVPQAGSSIIAHTAAPSIRTAVRIVFLTLLPTEDLILSSLVPPFLAAPPPRED